VGGGPFGNYIHFIPDPDTFELFTESESMGLCMINTRLFALGVAFVATFAVWVSIAVSYSASFSVCNPGYGCSHGAPIETTIGIILTPGALLLAIFIAVWARRGKVPPP